MEVTPGKLLLACMVMFGGMVAIGIATQSQGNEELKSSLSKIDFSGLRQRLQREEGIAEQPEMPIPETEEVTED